MPVSAESRYKTVSVVLTREQVRQVELLRELRSTHIRDVSASEVMRDIFDAGIEAIRLGRSSSFATEPDSEAA